MTKENPLIEQYNYWKPYQNAIEKLRENSPEMVEFSKLCFDTFETPAGKKLMEMLVERYLIPNLVPAGAPSYEIECVRINGFKEAYLLLREMHRQYYRQINKG